MTKHQSARAALTGTINLIGPLGVRHRGTRFAVRKSVNIPAAVVSLPRGALRLALAHGRYGQIRTARLRPALGAYDGGVWYSAKLYALARREHLNARPGLLWSGTDFWRTADFFWSPFGEDSRPGAAARLQRAMMLRKLVLIKLDTVLPPTVLLPDWPVVDARRLVYASLQRVRAGVRAVAGITLRLHAGDMSIYRAATGTRNV